jgi:hypothetical protein
VPRSEEFEQLAASPFAPPNAPLDVATPLKESDYVKSFSGYFLCALILGTLGGAATGGVIRGLWGASAGNNIAFGVFAIAASALVALSLSYAVFRFFLKEFIVQKLPPSRHRESDYLKAFVAYVVCSLLGGVFGGAAIGAVVGGVWGATGAPTNTFAFSATILPVSTITVVLIHYFVFRLFVKGFIVNKLQASADAP